MVHFRGDINSPGKSDFKTCPLKKYLSGTLHKQRSLLRSGKRR